MEYLIIFVKYGLPILAFIISLLSFWDSKRANKVQNRLQQVEEKIKAYELEEKEHERDACIEARAIKIEKNKYKLKIWNSGKETAYNIDFIETHNNEENQFEMIRKDKAPYEYLEGSKGFEESMIVFMGTPSKFELKTTWYDKNNDFQYKKQIISVP